VAFDADATLAPLANNLRDLRQGLLGLGQDVRVVELEEYVGGELNANLGIGFFDLEAPDRGLQVLDRVNKVEDPELRLPDRLVLWNGEREERNEKSLCLIGIPSSGWKCGITTVIF
jgi:hypothetical protein